MVVDVGDAGFEQVGVGGNAYVYGPTGSPWTFSTDGAGVTGDGSAFSDGNPDAPEGTQVGFLQGASSISQAVSGWDAGAYTISFQVAQRGNHGVSNQTVEVTVDDVVVAAFTPSGTSYEAYTTPSFTVTAGAHTIKLVGLANDDETVFVDSVAVAAAEIPASPPTAPTGVTATAAGSDGIDVSWSASPGASSYSIERIVDNGSAWTTVGTVGGDITTFTDLGLQEVTSYSYRIVAANAAGGSSPSAVASATTPPAAPTGLAATAVSGGRVDLTWVDRSTGETSYVVERSTGPNGPWIGLSTFVANTTSRALSGSYDGSTTYYFRVAAVASDVRSDAVVASLTTPAWPSAPRSLVVAARSATENDLSWSASTGASGYTIQRSTAGEDDWTTIATLSAGATSYSDPSVPQGEATRYRVMAANDDGSVPSASAVAHSNASWRPESGFTETTLGPGGAVSTEQAVDMGFSIVFGGHAYSTVWVNNDGDITFDHALNGSFNNSSLRVYGPPVVAAFLAGIDTGSDYFLLRTPKFSNVDDMPMSATRTVIAAEVHGILYFRIFDEHGRMVVDTNESALTGEDDAIDDIRNQLKIVNEYGYLNLTDQDREKLIFKIGRAVGYPLDHGSITYGTDVIDGHPAFGVNWNDVGVFRFSCEIPQDLRNTFQLVLIDRSDVAPGAFEIELNYDTIKWDQAVSNSDEFFACAGFADGTSSWDGFWNMDGSGVDGAFLDSNAETGLVNNSLRSDVLGRYRFLLVPDVVKDSAMIEAASGQAFSEKIIASFNDPSHPDAGPGCYSATIDWGDGSSSTGTVTRDGDVFNVQGGHAYDAKGLYRIEVTITADGNSMRETIESTAYVTDPDLAVTNPGDQGSVEGDSISLQISASNSSGDPLYYTASSLPKGLFLDPSTGLISGTIAPGAADVGSYDVELIIGNGNSAKTASFTWSVSPAATPTVYASSLDDQTPNHSVGLSQGVGDASFTISRNSGQGDLTVYFKLSGDGALGVDYDASFGAATGYIDESTGQGYVVIPAGSASVPIFINALAGGSEDDETVNLSLMGADDQFGGFIAYQSYGDAVTMNAVRKIAGAVSGVVNFNGNQPVRFAEVDVYQTFPYGSRKIGVTYTDADGNYTFSGKFSKRGTGVKLYVYTQSDPSQPMQTINVWSNGLTHYHTITQLWNPTAADANLTVPTATIADVDDAGKAFWVYDAAVTAALFEASIPGLKKGTTGIDYPAFSLGTSWTLGGTVHIIADDYAKPWTVMHEYGHSVAQDNNFFAYTDLFVGGHFNHRLDQPMREQWGWSRGLATFAFSEGWANYFSVAAQNFPRVQNVAFKEYSAETNESRGETDEVGVMQLLWDLADPANETADQVELAYGGVTGFQAVCKLIDDKDVTNVKELWQALLTTTRDAPMLAAYGKVFAAHGMAVGSLGMNIGGVATNSWTAGDPIPEFTWTIPDGSNHAAGPLFNEFEVVVYDDFHDWNGEADFYSGILSRENGRLTINGNQASWLPSQEDWQNIIASGSEGLQDKVFVIQSSDKQIERVTLFGGGAAVAVERTTGPYWSDGFAFTVTN